MFLMFINFSGYYMGIAFKSITYFFAEFLFFFFLTGVQLL